MKTIIKAGTNEQPDQIECENRSLAERIAQEGAVLLKNDGILPLQEKRTALYGSGARMTVKGGTGSGAVRERYAVNIADALYKEGFEITTSSWLDRFDAYYQNCYESHRQDIEKKIEGMTNFYQSLAVIIQHKFAIPTGIPVEEKDLTDSACDTAVFVISRQAGEGADRKNIKGDYQLDDMEVENLQKVSEYYKNLIVVINVGGVIDLSPIETMHVSALVYIGQAGEEGGTALASLISGKADFSGRLTMSWPMHYEDLPSAGTFAEASDDPQQQKYKEDRYVGYRYFDSFDVKARYLFGYGLSYTEFDTSLAGYQQQGDRIVLHVRTVNQGTVCGKAPIQIYASLPNAPEDHEEKRLAAFAKMAELRPGQEVITDVMVSLRDLTIFRMEPAAFILPHGSIVLRLGDSSHVLRNALVLHVKEDIMTKLSFHACPLQMELKTIVPAYHVQDLTGLPVLEIDAGQIACEKAESSEIKEDHENAGLLDRMNAADLADLVIGGTTDVKNPQVSAVGASGSTTSALYENDGIPNIILADGPQGLNLTSTVVQMADGTVKAARVPHVLEAYKRYLYGAAGKGLMMKMALPSDGIVHYQFATAWPSELVIAQTFNPALEEEMGDGVAKEMEKFGVTVWLGPALNIERNPLGGRTYEYYAEDPLLSGKTASAVVKGVQKHPGCFVSLKHFAANNAELNRNSSDSIVSERALRELYLKGFEIAVKESHPGTVMASYNRINGVYSTNNYDLLTKILRNEWGFTGMVMSDWDSMTEKTADVLKAHQAGCDLVMPGRADQNEALKKALQNGSVKIEDIRRCAENILKIIQQNNVIKIRKSEETI